MQNPRGIASLSQPAIKGKGKQYLRMRLGELIDPAVNAVDDVLTNSPRGAQTLLGAARLVFEMVLSEPDDDADKPNATVTTLKPTYVRGDVDAVLRRKLDEAASKLEP